MKNWGCFRCKRDGMSEEEAFEHTSKTKHSCTRLEGGVLLVFEASKDPEAWRGGIEP